MSIRRLLFLFSLTCLTMVGCGDEKDDSKSCDGTDCNVPADPCAKCTETQTCEDGHSYKPDVQSRNQHLRSLGYA